MDDDKSISDSAIVDLDDDDDDDDNNTDPVGEVYSKDGRNVV